MRSRKGITLIEVLITTLITLAALVGLFQAYISSVYMAQLNRDMTAALNDAQDMAETIHSTPIGNILVFFPDTVVNGPGANPYSGVVGGYTLNGEQITVNYTNTAARPLEIFITVSWQDLRLITRSVVLTTQKSH